MNNPIRLMAHLVAGYPDVSGCKAAARGLAEAGVSFLEIQLPFSDPSADGPLIQDACAKVLARGFSIQDGLELIADIHRQYPDIPIFVMAYANLVVTPGVVTFVDDLVQRGVRGIIVPDLPFDSDEGLADACVRVATDTTPFFSIPVAAPSMSEDRLERMVQLGRPYIYAALRTGITGAQTEINAYTRMFLQHCAAGGAKILGGFGIRTGSQAQAVADLVHAVVAGTVFVETINKALTAHAVERAGSFKGALSVRDEAIRRSVKATAQEIMGVA
jgi:tryptophan synthase alpha chain